MQKVVGDFRIRVAVLLAVFLVVSFGALAAGPSAKTDEKQALATAVALNYCRASFHRIRRYPSKRVLLEEREKILNNLNLNGIADEEVVQLYAAVLEEINHVQIADRERRVIRDRHRRAFYQRLTLTALDLSADLATARFASAVRTGAASWWDFRAMGWQTELDTWQLEKERLAALTAKSSQFLDTFWRLARKRGIPDRWLIRSADLDRLEETLKEPRLDVRLRVLRRMEKFMEAYPPYLYYVGRTEQQLGQLFAAANTFARLEEVGQGHFRKDDMLAAGLANRAVIQQYLGQRGAAETAARALRYSTDVWQVNLMCAEVLREHKQYQQAEDAILRNLDVDLERPQSLSALLLLYADWQQKDKLADRLAARRDIQLVPVPVLLDTARLLADDGLPAPLIGHLASTFVAYADLRFGRDDLVVSAGRTWQLAAARVVLVLEKQKHAEPHRQPTRDGYELRFRGVCELGNPLAATAPLSPATVWLQWPNSPPVRLHLTFRPPQVVRQTGGSIVSDAGRPAAPVVPWQRPTYQIVAVDVGETTLHLVGQPPQESPPPSHDEQAVPVPPEPSAPSRVGPAPPSEAPVPVEAGGDEAAPPDEAAPRQRVPPVEFVPPPPEPSSPS